MQCNLPLHRNGRAQRESSANACVQVDTREGCKMPRFTQRDIPGRKVTLCYWYRACLIRHFLTCSINENQSPWRGGSLGLQWINITERTIGESRNLKKSQSFLRWKASVSSVWREKTQLLRFILNISDQRRRKKDTQCALVRDRAPLKKQTVWQCFFHQAT